MSEFYIAEESNPLSAPWLKIDHFSNMMYRPYIQGVWHQHNLIEILFINEGTGYLHVGNRIISVSPNTVCIIPPYTLHFLSTDELNNLRYYSIGYYESRQVPLDSPGYIERGWGSPVCPSGSSMEVMQSRTDWQKKEQAPHPLVEFFERISCVVIPDSNPHDFVKSGFMMLDELIFAADRSEKEMELFQRLANDLFWLIRRELERKKAYSLSRSKIAIQDVLSYISCHYAEDLQLGDLAHRFGISPAHLNRLFNKYCSLSPRNYIIYYRMAIAIRLLVQSELSIADITEQVGYQTQAHFTKLFQQYVGCTPSDFRKLYPDALPSAPVH